MTDLLIFIDPADARPIYVQIMDEVRRVIATGVARPDEPLPSTRRLAQALQVNSLTVLQAYAELERSGIVYTLRGRGTFVSPTAPEAAGLDVARTVAERAMRDAHRHGMSRAELIDALRALPAPEERRVGATGGTEGAGAPDGVIG
jgi:GntR family transcriptional regulator